MEAKYLLIICDGMGDLPNPQYDNKTPLEAAQTPNLDRLAYLGKTGLMYVLGKGIRPNSDEAHLVLFGYDLATDYPGRGPIEAAGVGINLEEGDVAIRANLATVDENLRVIDRRAGRIEDCSPFVKDLDGIVIEGVKFIVKAGTGHRLVLVMRGEGLSDKISNSDVHYVTENKVVENWKGLPVNHIMPLDDSPASEKTAEILEKFLTKAHEILEKNPLNNGRELKANYILTRGPGYFKKLKPFVEKWLFKNAACIAGAGLYKGLGVMMGMDLIEVEGATGLPNTDVFTKIQVALEKIKDYDFIFLHIKPTDIFGENGDFEGKRDFIEKIDKAINHLENEGISLAVTADHSTPCTHKDHSSDPVPFVIYKRGLEGDKLSKFSERACRWGSGGIIEGKDFMKFFLEL